MHIYLLRHGDAPYDERSGERSLSARGKTETAAVVEQHLSQLSEVELIVCSPVLRARQTLQVLTETLNYSGELLFEDVLRSEGTVAAVQQYVDSLDVARVLLISHQPLIGQLLEYLVDEAGLAYSMTTSSLACLDAITFGRGCATLQRLTQP